MTAANRHAVFSPDRVYRYTLWRSWDELFGKRYVLFIGLNPSTADETTDDPTIRRCIRFAKQWGYSSMCMCNLFAFRATDPRDMKGCQRPIGPDNDGLIVQCARDATLIVAAWGVHGQFMARDLEVLKLIDDVHCLGTTKDGLPKHPLYLAKTCIPIPYDTEVLAL